MRRTYVNMLLIILFLVIAFSFAGLKTEEQRVKFKHLENFITEPKLYGKLGDMYMEISAKSGNKRDGDLLLKDILGKLYGENNNLLISLTSGSAIFDIESKVLTVNQELSVESQNFNLKSLWCQLKLDSNSVVFYKPKIEVL